MTTWTNKRFGKQKFRATYGRDTRGERVIEFLAVGGRRRVKTYESFVGAKNDGWKKAGSR